MILRRDTKVNKGTIVLARFPFTDFTSEKRRPALIISANNENKNDLIIAFISSVVPENLTAADLVLPINEPELKETRLHKTSVVRFDKIMTIEKNLITGEIGNLPAKFIYEADKRLKIVFGL